MLGNWKTELFPKKDADSNARPVMRFCLNGKVYYIVPKPGGDGLGEFKDTVRKLCNLSDDTQLDLSFQCSDPVGGKFSRFGRHAYEFAYFSMPSRYYATCLLPCNGHCMSWHSPLRVLFGQSRIRAMDAGLPLVSYGHVAISADILLCGFLQVAS